MSRWRIIAATVLRFMQVAHRQVLVATPATSSSSSSVAPGVGLGGSSGGHPPNKSDTAFPPGNHPKPGQTVTVSGGGSQSSCEAQSADHNSAGNRGFDYEQGSCSAHSP
jgi:hypothetical protein